MNQSSEDSVATIDHKLKLNRSVLDPLKQLVNSIELDIDVLLGQKADILRQRADSLRQREDQLQKLEEYRARDDEPLSPRRSYWSSSDSVEMENEANGRADVESEREDVEEQEKCMARQQKLSQLLDVDEQKERGVKADNPTRDDETGLSSEHTDKFKKILSEYPIQEELRYKSTDSSRSRQAAIPNEEQCQSLIHQLQSLLLERTGIGGTTLSQGYPLCMGDTHHHTPESSLMKTNHSQRDPLYGQQEKESPQYMLRQSPAEETLPYHWPGEFSSKEQFRKQPNISISSSNQQACETTDDHRVLEGYPADWPNVEAST